MNGKISAFQFYSVLFLTRLLTTLTYIPEYTEEITVSDMIFQTLFRFVFGIIITLPVFFLNKHQGNLGGEGDDLGKIKAVIFSIVFFYFSVATVARLDLFAGTVIFPETDAGFLLLFVVALCAYGAYLGLEALSRGAVIFCIPVILSLLLIIVALVKKVEFLNLSPLFYNGIMPVAKTALNAVGRTVEYAIIAVAVPWVKGNVKKGFYVWMAVQTSVTAMIFAFEALVLGRFEQFQLFPVYTLASMAEFSVFDGLEAIITGVWVLCAFLKISLLIYLQAKLLSEAFGVKSIKVITVVSIVLAVVCLFISGNVYRFNLIDSSGVKFILILICVPLYAIAELVKGKVKKCEKQP